MAASFPGLPASALARSEDDPLARPRRSLSGSARIAEHQGFSVAPTAISRPPPLDAGRPGSVRVGLEGCVGEPLKTFFSAALVNPLAADIARVYPGFPVRAFVKDACGGLDALELLDRGRHIAGALARRLPAAYPDAIEILLRSLGPEHASDELIGVGMAPFFYLPHTLFVAERGLDHFELSMQAQYELTKRFSAEGSIRPYISRDPERAMVFL